MADDHLAHHVTTMLRECGADPEESNCGLATADGRAGVLAAVRMNLNGEPALATAVYAELHARFTDVGASPDELARCTPDAPDDNAGALRLHPRLTRAEMANDTIQFVCPSARFLPRRVATLVTSAGGVGKTRFLVQLADALAVGAAPFGCPLLQPDGAQVVLYIGAEDHAPFFHSVVMPLLATDAATLPFDVVLLPDVRPGFTLSPHTIAELGRFLTDYRAAHGRLDVVMLDPIISLIGEHYVEMMKNPIVARAFYNACLQPLFAGQHFALLTGNHDSKSGNAVTGRPINRIRRGACCSSRSQTRPKTAAPTASSPSG